MTLSVLVTGGVGNVGRQLVCRLVQSNKTVRILDLPTMDFSTLEGVKNVDIIKGNITDYDIVKKSVSGIDAVVHLAALLPPSSERDREKTFTINFTGTETILKAMEHEIPDSILVFPSSVSTYGMTATEQPPITTDHLQNAIDIYAASKIEAETVVKNSSLRTVILRIAGIAVPEFLAPPAIWPFTSDQRVEMVHREDVVDALVASIEIQNERNKVFNIAGGPTWQLTGQKYVEDFYDFFGASSNEAVYRQEPGWMDWYNTCESQTFLRYQNRTYQHYSKEMRQLIASMMTG